MEDARLLLNNSRTYFLICGIANALSLVVGGIWVTLVGIGTCGVGCLFAFIPLINLTVMIMDFIAMNKLQEPPSPKVYSFLKMAATFDCFSGFAVVTIVLGILNLQLLGKPEVYAHFNSTENQS